MNDNSVLRSSLALTFEAQIIALLLFTTPYLTFSGASAIALFVALSVLFGAGALFYQKSSRGFLGLVLLSLTVVLVAVLAYLYTASVILALLGAAIYYWRLHARAAEGATLPELTKRFTIVMFTYVCLLIWLALTATVPLAGLTVAVSFSTICYLVVCYVEFLTREQRRVVSVGGAKLGVLASQQAGLQAGVIVVFLAAASLLYYLLAFAFALLKGPVWSMLKVLLMPLLLWIDTLVQALKQKASNNPALNNFLEQGSNAPPEYAPPPAVQHDLFSRLEPYLITLAALVILLFLGRKVWQHYKQNKRADQPSQPLAPAVLTVEKLAPATAAREEVAENLRKWQVPREDRIRYAYYRFLQQMNKHGLPIRSEETSSEFLQRIRSTCADGRIVVLAERITRAYEGYRYGGQRLAEDQLATIEAGVAELAASVPEVRLADDNDTEAMMEK